MGELKEFLQHAMRRIFLRSEIGESEIAHLALRGWLLQEAQNLVFRDGCKQRLRNVGSSALRVAEVHEAIQRGHAWATFAVAMQGTGVPGDLHEAVIIAFAPIAEHVVVEKHQVFRDLRLASELLVLI